MAEGHERSNTEFHDIEEEHVVQRLGRLAPLFLLVAFFGHFALEGGQAHGHLCAQGAVSVCKRTHFVPEHILYQNTLYTRTHSIQEYILERTHNLSSLFIFGQRARNASRAPATLSSLRQSRDRIHAKPSMCRQKWSLSRPPFLFPLSLEQDMEPDILSLSLYIYIYIYIYTYIYIYIISPPLTPCVRFCFLIP